MRVLFIGDIVGKPGRDGLAAAMPELRERYSPDLVVANAENSAAASGQREDGEGGCSSSAPTCSRLGNHSYRHREVYDFLDREPTASSVPPTTRREPRPRPHHR